MSERNETGVREEGLLGKSARAELSKVHAIAQVSQAPHVNIEAGDNGGPPNNRFSLLGGDLISWGIARHSKRGWAGCSCIFP